MQEEGKHSRSQWRSQTDPHWRQGEDGCRYPQSFKFLEVLTWALADGYRHYCQKFHKLLIAPNPHTLYKLDSFLVSIFIVIVTFSMLAWLSILYMEYTVLTMLNVKLNSDVLLNEFHKHQLLSLHLQGLTMQECIAEEINQRCSFEYFNSEKITDLFKSASW